ncbi:MAG: hypothetical protein Unbinned767contig1000_2 [Prokaryotic dsDNA virus sp.]|nr:MAG: hypothetical protein Unbinned767contig1000_2 [Prokaryotic dsDNA virus sp.]
MFDDAQSSLTVAFWLYQAALAMCFVTLIVTVWLANRPRQH